MITEIDKYNLRANLLRQKEGCQQDIIDIDLEIKNIDLVLELLDNYRVVQIN